MVKPSSPAPSRTATSTALPVGRQHQQVARWQRCAAARSARIEVVLPAPAGADSGCTSHGERADVLHGALLVRRQLGGVLVVDPQHGRGHRARRRGRGPPSSSARMRSRVKRSWPSR